MRKPQTSITITCELDMLVTLYNSFECYRSIQESNVKKQSIRLEFIAFLKIKMVVPLTSTILVRVYYVTTLTFARL